MQSHTGSRKAARIGVRLSPDEQREIEQTAKARGYSSATAFIRAAVQNEINRRAELTGTEERIAERAALEPPKQFIALEDGRSVPQRAIDRTRNRISKPEFLPPHREPNTDSERGFIEELHIAKGA